MKIILRIIIFIAVLIATLFLLWCLMSGNKIREYKDRQGNTISGSVSEKNIVEINGVKNGLFINSRDDSNPVLLLVSSGPGTDDYFLTERFSDMHIDDIFTLVYWDYRGMGIAYDSCIDSADITSEVLLEDTRAVTEYLMDRFCVDKIFIMGFSGGTKIAAKAAHEHPELYYAYIGMAQLVTDSAENDQLMYDFMKSVFEERNDSTRLRKLEELVYRDESGLHTKDWYSYVMLLHEAGGGTIYNETEFWGIDIPIMMSHCYTVTEKINYIRGMKMYRKTPFAEESKGFDYRISMNEFEIPVYFLSGKYDFNCPQPLVKDYCEKITAPDKGFYLVDNAAHSPMWENAEESFRIMEEIKEKCYSER